MKNEYIIKGNVVEIKLVRKDGTEYTTIVDKKSLDNLLSLDIRWNAVTWPNSNTLYVQGTYTGNGTKKTIILHRFLLNNPKGKVVDHINHNTLDNRLSNLRPVSRSVNGLNRKGPQADNKSSKIQGITFNNSKGKWSASTTLNKRKIYLGLFNDLEKAESIVTEFRKKFAGQENCEDEINDFIIKSRSGYRKGKSNQKHIQYHRLTGKWSVVVKRVHLGLFPTLEEAVKFRDDYLKTSTRM